MIPLSVPEIRGNEWKYIKECLDTNWVSSVGTFVEKFEDDLSNFIGAKYAVATSSGTSALHIALLVAGIKQNEEVIVSSLSFIAPANAIRYVGAFPIFIDADPDYFQLDTKKLSDFIAQECKWINGALINKSSGRKITAIIPVHILGHPCDMDEIIHITRQYNLKIIEDAAESLGAKYKDKMVGSLGDISCYSFNGNKIITTGGGGMITTDNYEWAEKAKYLTTQAKDHPTEYIHNEIGYNYRLTNIQAALGCAQLEQLPKFIEIKRYIAHEYFKNLDDTPGITLPKEAPWATSIFWLFTLLVDSLTYGISNRELLKYLDNYGIQSRPLWQPLNASKAHASAINTACNISEMIAKNALSIPSSVGLTTNEQTTVIETIKNRGNLSQ